MVTSRNAYVQEMCGLNKEEVNEEKKGKRKRKKKRKKDKEGGLRLYHLVSSPLREHVSLVVSPRLRLRLTS